MSPPIALYRITGYDGEYVGYWYREHPSFFKTAPALTYQDRLKKSFNIDPFKCPHCGNRLILYEVWHPKHGTIYNIFRDERWIDYVVEEKRPENSRAIQRDSQLFLFEMPSSN